MKLSSPDADSSDQAGAGDVHLEQAQVARIAVVQPVAFEVERLDVAGAVGDQEDLAFFEDGPLEDGPGLGRCQARCRRYAFRAGRSLRAPRRRRSSWTGASSSTSRRRTYACALAGQVGPAAGARQRLVPAGNRLVHRAAAFASVSTWLGK